MPLTQVQGGMILPSTTLTTPIVATTMGVGGATPSTSGSGITFPATQSASTDANTLDDYEEGTFTPSISSISGSYTTANVTGAYIKIGKTVTLRLRASITTNGTAAAAMLLGNFPFPAAIASDFGGASREDVSQGLGYVFSGFSPTTIYINRYDGVYGFANNTGITFCISYIAAT